VAGREFALDLAARPDAGSSLSEIAGLQSCPMAGPVLLVLDDIAVIAAAKRLLSREGIETLLVSNVADAIIMFGDLGPEVVVISASVDGGRGASAYQEIRAHPAGHATRFVVLGDPIPEAAEARVVALPLDGDVMIEAVKAALAEPATTGGWQATAIAQAPDVVDDDATPAPTGPETWRVTSAHELEGEASSEEKTPPNGTPMGSEGADTEARLENELFGDLPEPKAVTEPIDASGGQRSSWTSEAGHEAAADESNLEQTLDGAEPDLPEDIARDVELAPPAVEASPPASLDDELEELEREAKSLSGHEAPPAATEPGGASASEALRAADEAIERAEKEARLAEDAARRRSMEEAEEAAEDGRRKAGAEAARRAAEAARRAQEEQLERRAREEAQRVREEAARAAAVEAGRKAEEDRLQAQEARRLLEEEKRRAEEEKRRTEEEDRRRQEEEARHRVEAERRDREEAARQAAEEERDRRRAEEEQERLKSEAEGRRRMEEEIRRRVEEELRRQLQSEAAAPVSADEDLDEVPRLAAPRPPRPRGIQGRVRSTPPEARGESRAFPPEVQDALSQAFPATPEVAPEPTLPPFAGQGSLAEIDAARLLAETWRGRVTGRFDFDCTEGARAIWFEFGRLVGVASSAPFERIEEVARREGLVTKSQHRVLRAAAVDSPRRLAVRMVEMGFIKATELYPLVRRRAEEILFALFADESSPYRYVPAPGSLEERLVLPSHPLALMTEGIRRKFGSDRLHGLVGGPGTVLKPSPGGPELADFGFSAREKRVAALVDGLHTLEEVLFESGINELASLKVLYALVAAGAAEIAVMGVPTEAPRAKEGKLDLDRVTAKYEQVLGGDYFEILGLRRSATGYEVRAAYERLAREFDTGRFVPMADAALNSRIQEIHRALAEACDVLSDDLVRADYARNLLE
jgi:colicin import membrane protein